MQRKYVIDEYIVFTPADGCLRLIKTVDTDTPSHLLPPAAARLLLVLLQHNGELVTKENLLAEVWENHGMTGSLHNLAHYTMLIRKAFRALHYDKKIIITVHKQGIMINPEVSYRISVQQQDEQQPEVESSDDDYPDRENVLPPLLNESLLSQTEIVRTELPPPARKRKRLWLIALFTFLFVTVVGLVVFHNFSNTDSKYNAEHLRLISTDNKCKFYTYNSKVDDKQLMVWIRLHTDKFNLHCNQDRVIIYYTDAFLGPNFTGKHFHTSLIICLDSSDLKLLNSCVSHYYN
ncbi:winged helix-turn-helix domain-containing protein [Lelliottia nimipressuralis]|uniref:winged helix-turn-helix domain-containing protein n=1 Tax=Lelliottia nimipressuralis TaxID=69220 RepID=UPI003D2B1689